VFELLACGPTNQEIAAELVVGDQDPRRADPHQALPPRPGAARRARYEAGIVTPSSRWAKTTG